MQSLKNTSILQKFKAFFATKKSTCVENVFGDIELIPLQSNLIQFGSRRKEPEKLLIKQPNPATHHHKFYFGQSKKRSLFLKLIQNIKKTQQKNLQVYAKIMTICPQFTHALFQPKTYQNTDNINSHPQQQTGIYQQELLSQIDRLYQQNYLLQKQLTKLKSIQQNDQKLRQQEFNTVIGHYQFLRSTWWYKKNTDTGKSNSLRGDGQLDKSDDRIEKLSVKVALVKDNINRILEQQQHMKHPLPQQNHIEDQFVKNSATYRKLMRLYQQTQMKLQQQRSYTICQIQKTKLRGSPINQIETQNSQKSEVQGLREDIKFLQNKKNQSLEQIVGLNQQIILKDKQLSRYKRQEKHLRTLFYAPKQPQNETTSQIIINDKNFVRSQQNKSHTCQFRKGISWLIQILESVTQQNKSQQSVCGQIPGLNFDGNRVQGDRSSLGNQLESVLRNGVGIGSFGLVIKENKLSQPFDGLTTMGQNVSREKQIKLTKRNNHSKQNLSYKPNKLIKCLNIPFSSIKDTINVQSDLKLKFTRTSNYIQTQNFR